MQDITDYMLRCGDGSYYVGLTQRPLEQRVAEHNAGALGGYTARRRPAELVWCQTPSGIWTSPSRRSAS